MQQTIVTSQITCQRGEEATENGIKRRRKSEGRQGGRERKRRRGKETRERGKGEGKEKKEGRGKTARNECIIQSKMKGQMTMDRRVCEESMKVCM